MIQSLLAGGIDGRQAIGGNTAEDGDHLPITIMDALQPPTHFLHGRWQNPFAEWGTVAQSAGFASQNRHIVPRIVDRLATAKATRMLTDIDAILPDHDLLGIGMNLDRAADRRRADGVFVVVEADRAGLRHRGRDAVETVERPDIMTKLPRSASNICQIVRSACSG